MNPSGAVIYCRVSTKEQAQNFSLGTQERECRLWCERNAFGVDQVFVDAGESAKTADRPEFQRLLAYCRTNKKRLAVLVVHSLSRFSRNTTDHHAVRAVLMGLGITLRSVTEPNDDSPEGLLIEDIMAGLAHYDNRAKARRTKIGMTAALQAGRWTFAAPVGYLTPSSKTGPSLIADPERGPLVTRAFEEMASGLKTRAEVLRVVTGLGLRGRNGASLSPQTFHQLLKNPIYAGRIAVPSLGVEADGDFAPLVSQQLFGRVQAVLNGDVKAVVPHLRNHPDFPLRRFVLCGACGTPLTASWSTGRSARYPYYHCRKCKAVKVRREQLESRFVRLLETLQPNPGYMQLFREIVLDVWRHRQADSIRLRKAGERQAEELRQRLDRVEDAFIQKGAIDRASYERQRDRLREELALVEMQNSDAKLEEMDVEGVLAFAEHVLTNTSRLWLGASLDQKQRLQSVLFPGRLRFDGQEFGTATTCLAFKQLPPGAAAVEGLASPPGSAGHCIVLAGKMPTRFRRSA